MLFKYPSCNLTSDLKGSNKVMQHIFSLKFEGSTLSQRFKGTLGFCPTELL